jgi:hypothetical protein
MDAVDALLERLEACDITDALERSYLIERPNGAAVRDDRLT